MPNPTGGMPLASLSSTPKSQPQQATGDEVTSQPESDAKGTTATGGLGATEEEGTWEDQDVEHTMLVFGFTVVFRSNLDPNRLSAVDHIALYEPLNSR